MQHLDKSDMVESMAYKQLNIEEREAIQVMRWEHRSIRYMARMLGRSPSTISREFGRHKRGNTYTPRAAHERTTNHIRERGRRPRLKAPRVRQYVEEKLKESWSPEQIAGRMGLEHPDWPKISHEAIYQFVYVNISINANASGDDLRKYLRRHHRIRKKKGVCHSNRGAIAGRIGIEERPEEVEYRNRFGDWEHDSIVSRQSSILLNSLVERKSGLLKLSKVADSTGQATAEVV